MFRIFKHFWPEIKRYKVLAFIMFVGITSVVAIDLLIPYYFRTFADLITSEFTSQPENFDTLMSIFAVIVMLYAGLWIFWRVNEYTIIFFQTRVMRELEKRAFKCLHSQTLGFFKDSFAGSLAKKVSRFTNSFEDLTDIIYFNFYPEFLKITVIFIIFLNEKLLLGFIFLAWSFLFLGGSYVFAIWKLKYDIKVAEADSRISAVMVDSISNFFSVKTFAQEKSEQKRFNDYSQGRYERRKLSWILQSYFNTIQAAFMISFELLLFYLMIQWWKAGTFDVGDFIFFQAYLLVLFHGLWEFSRHIQRTFESIAYAKEMVDILENNIEIKDKISAKPLDLKRGEIEFKNVNFTFSADNKVLFPDLSLKIQSGEKVALVGPSGAGKSTLVKLLFRFYDCNKGKIFIDGQDISEITQSSLRENITLVPQTPDLFHRSIAENIAFGAPNATKSDIEYAARLAHADVFVKHLPKKYDTLVGERGVKLSGGERQRIAIARAFLENATILVLDEATSALDSLTEKNIQAAIAELVKNRTSIVIAHRLSTILHMDRIIVMKDGEIVEQGNHNELLRKRGLYQDLWSHQAGGFLPGK